jgi:hypothetical protein
MFFDKIKKTSSLEDKLGTGNLLSFFKSMPDSSPDPDLKLMAKGGPVYGKKISEPEH